MRVARNDNINDKILVSCFLNELESHAAVRWNGQTEIHKPKLGSYTRNPMKSQSISAVTLLILESCLFSVKEGTTPRGNVTIIDIGIDEICMAIEKFYFLVMVHS